VPALTVTVIVLEGAAGRLDDHFEVESKASFDQTPDVFDVVAERSVVMPAARRSLGGAEGSLRHLADALLVRSLGRG
jgi:hypothetical protein